MQELYDALLAECKSEAIRYINNKSLVSDLYNYNGDARRESIGKISDAIRSYETRIRYLKELQHDFCILTDFSKHVRDMGYDDFMDIELKYRGYETTI